MDMLLEAERVLVENDAACAPMFFEGQTRLVSSNIKNFVYHRYGGYAMTALEPPELAGGTIERVAERG